MKRFQSTLISLILLIFLTALTILLYFNKKHEQLEEEKKLQVLNFDEKKIKKISIVQADSKIILTKINDSTRNNSGDDKSKTGEWQITEPYFVKPAIHEIEYLISILANLKAIKTIKVTKESLKKIGLDKPKAKIIIESEDVTKELLIGAITTTEGDFYAKVLDQENHYVLSRFMVERITQDINSFRNRSLWNFDVNEVSKLNVWNPRVVWSVERERLSEGKTSPWTVSWHGKKMLAKSREIEAILEGLKNLKIEKFIADHITSSELEKYRLNKPAMKVTISSFSGQDQILLISSQTQSKSSQSRVYIMLDQGRSIYGMNSHFTYKLYGNATRYAQSNP